MNINKLTASKIKENRLKKDYSSEGMAQELQISKSAYSQMENGKVEITLTRIEQIAQILNIPISELVPSSTQNYQVAYGTGDNISHSTKHVNNNNFFDKTEEQIHKIIEDLTTALHTIKNKG